MRIEVIYGGSIVMVNYKIESRSVISSLVPLLLFATVNADYPRACCRRCYSQQVKTREQANTSCDLPSRRWTSWLPQQLYWREPCRWWNLVPWNRRFSGPCFGDSRSPVSLWQRKQHCLKFLPSSILPLSTSRVVGEVRKWRCARTKINFGGHCLKGSRGDQKLFCVKFLDRLISPSEFKVEFANHLQIICKSFANHLQIICKSLSDLQITFENNSQVQAEIRKC